MDFLYLKALHVIFIVTWFSGMFYIVRLFIYNTEAAARTEPERSILQQQFGIMSKRLWYGITVPSASAYPCLRALGIMERQLPGTFRCSYLAACKTPVRDPPVYLFYQPAPDLQTTAKRYF